MLEGSSVMDSTLDAASRCVAVCHGILESRSAGSRSKDMGQAGIGSSGCDGIGSSPSVINADFDFSNNGNIELDFSGSPFLQQWRGPS